MNRCPITYEALPNGALYSPRGLKLLHRNLRSLAPLEFTAEQQRQEAISRAGKMSVQGLQLKLSAVLRITEGRFEVVDRGGRYILKPQSLDFPELPENGQPATCAPGRSNSKHSGQNRLLRRRCRASQTRQRVGL